MFKILKILLSFVDGGSVVYPTELKSCGGCLLENCRFEQYMS